MYFEKFPTIFYDFKYSTNSTETVLHQLTDITQNVRFRKTVLENISLYDMYDIKEGETPEIIAEKIYGNPELHWVIMLANQRYDYLKDFPMNSYELDQYVSDKYGEENKYLAHHFELNGLTVDAQATIKVPSSVSATIKENAVLSTPTTLARVNAVTQSNIDTNTFSITISKGTFKYLDVVTMKKYEPTPLISTFTLGQNPFTLNTAYTPITNFDYEVSENEKKRTIKIISPSLIEQILKELDQLV